eukprot:TRINITY_DN15265_c1_g1_i3.p1 TRINITY_DN15265_c1_g1~~TRINITY_DN15265_c1_g1_i3.p1  ORF type:complete len:348 (+),score=56.93 TRINITY_DN15265_c1_g1_i3:147-1046(+)
MAVSSIQSFECGHQDNIHDAQLDYCSRRLATCSSDCCIRLFEVAGGKDYRLVAELRGHQGPVWQVCWGHPKYGNLLASCSFDRTIIVWKEVSEGRWEQIYQTPANLHFGSINSICWAPHELGATLACASSDETVSILEFKDGQWISNKIDKAHKVGVFGVSWAPAIAPGAMVSAQEGGQYVRRLVTCGCDNQVKVWSEQGGQWVCETTLKGHENWVRDVAWAPDLGLPRSTIASAGQDGKVFVWKEESPGNWKQQLLNDFGGSVWRLSWSLMGNVLAVSDNNNQVTVWKESLLGEWQQL